MLKHLVLIIAFLFLLMGCHCQPCHKKHLTKAPIYHYTIIKEYPHDRDHFTQGLIFDDGFLYESAGLYGHSKLIKMIWPSGKIVASVSLPRNYFAEGITLLGSKIYQLTYKERTGFIYNKDTLKLMGQFHYFTKGWGLTTDGQMLIMSNGSSTLYFMNPQTFKVQKKLQVEDGNRPVYFLNGLDYYHGVIYANVWKSELIAMISPRTGKILGWINLKGINPDPAKLKGDYVLNGITHYHNHLLVTGKCWPKIYEIDFGKGR